MSGILVFQDMVMTGPPTSRDVVAAALSDKATTPWRFDPDGSKDAARNALGQDGVLIFQREADMVVPAARLVLWPQEDGYYVPNVVPVAIGELTIDQYNAVISDFAETIAKPVARQFGWKVGITAAKQDLEDWLAEAPAAALRRFSAAANKSTGAGHPMDERRWFDFIIAAHRSGGEIGTDRLARWLHEVEGWDERSAHKLAGEYERGIALLSREAETR